MNFIKKSIYFDFFYNFWYKFDLFRSDSNFLIIFEADLIDFVATIILDSKISDRKSWLKADLMAI